MTQQNDQYGRYQAPLEYNFQFEDHPFPPKRRWLIPFLIASALLMLVVALVWA